MIQVKILYGKDRCKVKTYNNDEQLFKMSLDSFKNDIKRFVGGTFLVSDRVRIEYRDDEGTYVTMYENSDLKDAIRCLSAVPNTDNTLRMVIKIDESTTPVILQGKQYSPQEKKSRFSSTTFASTIERATPLVKKKLTFSNKTNNIFEDDDYEETFDRRPASSDEESQEESDMNNSTQLYQNTGKTPIARYIEKTQHKIKENDNAIEKLKREERLTKQRIAEAKSNNQSVGNLCSRCHLRMGHTVRTCIFERCDSVFKCGEEKQHPGEIDTRKKKNAIVRLESIGRKLEAELQNKKDAAEKVGSSIVNRLEEEILAVDQASYTFNGFKNWSLLRKHVFILQSYCKRHYGGKIPPRHKVMECLRRAIQEDESVSSATVGMSQVRSRRVRENPFKDHLEKQGIVFPRSSETISKMPTSDMFRYAPQNEVEEDEQFRMALSISSYDTEPRSETRDEFEQYESVTDTPGPAMSMSSNDADAASLLLSLKNANK